MRPEKLRNLPSVEKLAMGFTSWLGSVQSVIIHTILFAASFSLWFFGVEFNSILLILTTIVSLEAIYLALFIQMTVNRNTKSLEDVEEDVAEIAEDVEDTKESIDKLEETVDDLDEGLGVVQKTVQNIDADIDTVHAGIRDLDTDLDKGLTTVHASIKDIDQDIEEISEGDDKQEAVDSDMQKALLNIHLAINKLTLEVEKLKK